MPIYASKKTHTRFANPYRCRFQTPLYDAKKRPFFEKTGVRFLNGIYGRFETAIIWLSKTDERFLRGIYKWLFRND